MIKKILIFLFIFSLFSFFISFKTYASNNLPVVTVINPVREPGMQYIPGKLIKSIEAQFQITNDEHIPATWLWQYAVLYDKPVVDFAEAHANGQEYGLFFEVDPQLADDAHVVYRGIGPWYFSNRLLLSSYDPDERQKLIDTAFVKFKNTFGYYPKTVGAWWIGADSLDYMHKKYGVVASLRAADQFDLDVYSIWGTPWSIPYVSAKTNAAIPAQSIQNSTGVVMLQWAARDPLQGYGSGFANGTFSVQDYSLKGYGIDYFTYLLNTYLQKPMDNAVVGLEGGFDPAGYSNEYKNKMQILIGMQEDKKISLMLAKDYAQKFITNGWTIAPSNYLLTKDFKTSDQSFWFTSSSARVGIQKRGDHIFLVDLRNYTDAGSEDFLQLPNSQPELRINTPAQIDSARNQSEEKLLTTSGTPLSVSEKNGSVLLVSGSKKIGTFSKNDVAIYQNNSVLFQTSAASKNDVHVFWILFALLVFYSMYIYFYTKSVKISLIMFFLLICALLITKQFLSDGVLGQFNFSFDKKMLFLFLIPKMNFSLHANALIVRFQALPFLFLLGAHFLFIVKKWTKQHVVLYGVSVGLYIFFYANLFYFPLDQTTYKTIGISYFLFAMLLIFISIIFWKMTKSFKKFLFSLLCSAIILILGVFIIVFSRQAYVITPFEQNALNTIYQSHKRVTFLLPKDKPVYKAERPLLLEYTTAGEFWTNTKWFKATSIGSLDKNTILFVPRYLGSSITDKDIRIHNLVKIFDNAQIALYEEK